MIALALALVAIAPWKQELWRDRARLGAVVYAASCDPRQDVDVECSRFQIGDDPRFVPADHGYLPMRVRGASVLWSRGQGERGPDVVLLGNPGGSGGCKDIVAVTFDHGPQIELTNICTEDTPTAEHQPDGPRIVYTPRTRSTALVWGRQGGFEREFNRAR